MELNIRGISKNHVVQCGIDDQLVQIKKNEVELAPGNILNENDNERRMRIYPETNHMLPADDKQHKWSQLLRACITGTLKSDKRVGGRGDQRPNIAVSPGIGEGCTGRGLHGASAACPQSTGKKPRKVHGSLARAGKVKGQTPKVEKQEKKKKKTGRAKRRCQYNKRFVNTVQTFGRRRGPNANS
ncbi:unnamed protein product [Bemisia tabaci]|uniref:40S ribosomal protein S30 n=1 Tax=Bemisia tabaci TaxID=7038 RepID=A0A9P0A444_BEMTA|nr:unnamed protein product [Bemisia tabaci]